MKTVIAILLLTLCAAAQDNPMDKQFPENPEPIKASPSGGWAHDKSQDPPRWYQHTFTWKFDLSVGALLGTNIADIELTQHCEARGTCLEGGSDAPRGGQFESRGEMYRNDMIVDGAVILISTIIQAQHYPKKMGWISHVPLVIGTGRHIQGIVQGMRYY